MSAEGRLYAEAAYVARIAMGWPEKRGRVRPKETNADRDPLAWHLLTESIVAIAERHSKRQTDAVGSDATTIRALPVSEESQP